jgi:hypothetical protein
MDTWYDLNVDAIEPPEDWSGSMDIQRADYGVDLELRSGDHWNNPLDQLDTEE